MITKRIKAIPFHYYLVNYSLKTDNFEAPMKIQEFTNFKQAETFLYWLRDKLDYGIIIEAKEIANYRND